MALRIEQIRAFDTTEAGEPVAPPSGSTQFSGGSSATAAPRPAPGRGREKSRPSAGRLLAEQRSAGDLAAAAWVAEAYPVESDPAFAALPEDEQLAREWLRLSGAEE